MRLACGHPTFDALSRRIALILVLFLLSLAACSWLGTGAGSTGRPNLHRAKIFLAAADYRRALEACQQEVTEHPSADSYTYVTYVYQALDAYLDSLSRADRWTAVEQLVRSLSSTRPEELIDSPDVLARIAKELIHDAATRQADVAAAMATRLDEPRTKLVWVQQKQWREQHPDRWWFGVPAEWNW